MNKFAVSHDSPPNRLDGQSIQNHQPIALQWSLPPVIHRIVIVGNIGIFRRIYLTATMGPTCTNVEILKKTIRVPYPVEFRCIQPQDVNID